VITAKSAHRVARTSARRLGHPTRAGVFFGLVTNKSFCFFSFLFCLHPLPGTESSDFLDWKFWLPLSDCAHWHSRPDGAPSRASKTMFHSYPNLYIANLFSGPCNQSKKEMIDVHTLKMPNCTQLTSFVDIMSSFHKNKSNHRTSQESQKTSNLSQIRLQYAFDSLDSYLNNTHHTGTTP